MNKSGSGHFKKQWLMKNTEETKEVPDVDEIVREELRNELINSVAFSYYYDPYSFR